MKSQCVFVNTEQEPEKTEHICFFTRASGNSLELVEVQRVFYPHPDAEGHALVSVIQELSICKRNRTDFKAAPLVLLEAAQKNAFIS